MFLQFLRNHPDSNKPAFNNSLIEQGEPWRLHFHHVRSMWADRDIAGDGNKIYSYHLTMEDGSTTKVDAAVWMLTDIESTEPDYTTNYSE